MFVNNNNNNKKKTKKDVIRVCRGFKINIYVFPSAFQRIIRIITKNAFYQNHKDISLPIANMYSLKSSASIKI